MDEEKAKAIEQLAQGVRGRMASARRRPGAEENDVLEGTLPVHPALGRWLDEGAQGAVWQHGRDVWLVRLAPGRAVALALRGPSCLAGVHGTLRCTWLRPGAEAGRHHMLGQGRYDGTRQDVVRTLMAEGRGASALLVARFVAVES